MDKPGSRGQAALLLTAALRRFRRTDIKTVQGNAGHGSLATTDFYARYVKEAQIRAMQENAL